jgi:hypothetical protein
MNDQNIPESLREVWRWKEAVAKEWEGLSPKELIRHINETSERLLREQGIVLPRHHAAKPRK